jgi:hypothetical protein
MTQFYEVRYPQATPKQPQESLILAMRLGPALASVVALCNTAGLTSPAL